MFMRKKSKGPVKRPFELYLENAFFLRDPANAYFHTALLSRALISFFHAPRTSFCTSAGIGT
jgi:hypothetical protein